MSLIKISTCLAAITLSFCSILFADNTTVPNNALGQVQFSGYASTNKNESGLFTADFLVPLWYPSDKDTLLFFNPKDTITDPFANEIHQGLGLRHIFDDSYILGINSFFDRREDSIDGTNVWSSQTGIGLEYLSYPLDMRLNWYKPTTGAKNVDTTYGFGQTGLIVYNQRAEPLQGQDFEVGVPVLDKYTKTRLYLGGYFYQSRLSKDVNGFRARTETHLTKWLYMDTTINSNIDNRVEFYGGLRVSLAFDLANLFGKHGKTFFSTPSEPRSNNTYLEDRIFDRVVRDIDIQHTTSTSQSNGQSLVYVNNSNTSGTQNGSLQYPYTTIAQGLIAAGSSKWVYVEGQNASDYAGNITLSSSQVLWGSGYNDGFNGLPVSGVYPAINGNNITGTGITLDNNNTVMGLKIENFTGDGITFTNGTTHQASIIGNIIDSNDNNGIDFSDNTGNMSDVIIADNTINSNGNDGINLSYNNGQMTGFTISNNTISNNTTTSNGNDGIDLSANGYFAGTGTMTDFTITNNIINNNTENGIDLATNGYNTSTGTMTDFNISGNTINSNGYDGIAAYYNGAISGHGTMTGFTISNNTINNNAEGGIDLSLNSVTSGHGTMTDFTITGNTINGNNDGIGLNSGGSNATMSNFTIFNNTINNNSQNGIDLFGNNGAVTDLTVSYNTFNNNQNNGINLLGNSATMTGFTISNNIANNNVDSGIAIDTNEGTMTNFTISKNIADSNDYDGINLSNNGKTMSNFTISNNTTNSNGNDGIDLSYNGTGGTSGGTMTGFSISNNTANNNANDGLDLSNNGFNKIGTMSDFTISYNTFKNNLYDGIDLSYNGDNGTGTMTGFTITHNVIYDNHNDPIDQSNNTGTMSDFSISD